MQSEKQKKPKKKFNLFFILIVVSLVFLTALSFFLIYMVFIDVPLELKLKKISENETVLKLAEDAYNSGYLENSAIQYRNYLFTNPEKSKKIRVYQKLFEIAIIRSNTTEALGYLADWELIDKKNPLIVINRIKVYIRLKQYGLAKKEIDRYYSKFQKVTEYRDLTATYYMTTEDYTKALEEFSKISFSKREFSTHKKVVYCMIHLDQISNAKAYLNRIEPKTRLLELKENKAELILLKAIILMFKGEVEDAYAELRVGSLSERYKRIYLKLLIYCNMLLDRESEINTILDGNEPEAELDASFYAALGDYFIYKKSYNKAFFYYEKLQEERPLTQMETMALADILYYMGEYDEAIRYYQLLYSEYEFKNALYYKNISLIYQKKGENENEYFFLDEGLKNNPEDVELHVRTASYLLFRKDPERALGVLDQAIQLIRAKNLPYDKRIDLLRVACLNFDKKKLTERNLLELRETGSGEADHYFRLIQYYLKNKMFTDASRELGSLSLLPLDKKQQEVLSLYAMMNAFYSGDEKETGRLKDVLKNAENRTTESSINLSIIHIMDEEFQSAQDVLNRINPELVNERLRAKIYYLKGVVYYFKKDYPSSYKMLQSALEIDQSYRKASYLKSLIDKGGI